MDVVSRGPLPVASVLWQPRAGLFSLTVVCKATFELRPGESVLAAHQEPPSEEDNHWNDDPSRSVYSPGDLVPFKVRSDVVLVGSAFAASVQPVRSLVARLVVGAIDKSIEVVGDRTIGPEGQLREGPRFVKMPLRYERAASGPETENPVGMRLDGPPDAQGAVAVPNLQPPGLMVQGRGDFIPVIGFGPIASSWPSRRTKLGRHAGSWPDRDWAERPVPDDIDRSFFNVAPRDQQGDAIRPNERLVLESLHPQHSRLVTSLPSIHPRAIVERPGAAPSELALTADTLWIDTDRGICTVTWRGQVLLAGRNEAGQVVVTAEMHGEAMGEAQGDMEAAQTLVPFLASSAAMPFVGGNPAQSPMARPHAQTMKLSGSWGGDAEEVSVDADELIEPDPADGPVQTLFLPMGPKASPAQALPFAPAPAVAPAAPMPPAAPAPPVPPAPPPVWDRQPPAAPVPPPRASSPWAGNALSSNDARPSPSFGQPPPPPPEVVPPMRGSAGALDFSNDAARREDVKPKAVEAAAPAAPAPEVKPKGPREVIKLLWFDPKSVGRIRKHVEWRVLLAELELRLLDEGIDDEEEKASGEEASPRDKRDVFEVLAKGRAGGPEGVKVALDEAVGDDGRFEPPLMLLSGELEFSFDEVERLRATAAAMAPLAGDVPKLPEQLEKVQTYLKTPWAQGSGEAAAEQIEKLEGVFTAAKVRVPAHIEKQAERMLLEQRCYKMRTVFGKRWIRSALGASGVPVYVPEALKDELPMFKKVRVKLIGEVDMQEDQFEASGAAIKVVALGRVMGTGS
ncbi:MAG: DUF2169 domain-containing protein [Byssovorax sp.]